jgi:tetratricopeptide (TPR) repeat protein
MNEAITEWEKASDLDTDWAVPANGLGLIYNKRKDFGTARIWFNRAILRDATWAIPYSNMGTSYYMQKRYADAAANYQKALELAPLWARPHAWMASIAMKSYDCSTAVAHFERVLAADAVGTEEMDLPSIRRQYQEAQNCNYYDESSDGDYGF